MNVLVISALLNQYEWQRQVADIEQYLSVAMGGPAKIFYGGQ
jgi:hypothetical protein